MGYYILKKSTKTVQNQKYYFVLKASNGETIATSEMYSTKQAAQNGIRSVQQNGSSADVRDQT
ncbi:MAG: YegP family protein [Pantoea sp.]|uniref:YegP family protein n=1 Tax=unclassified Pantoea TaxID=2630326 RepID=UPI002395D2AA|nr:YegP family protein [Pantoea sp.]MDE1186167.1 YegP family protein [Pantoea sp.]